MGSVPYAPCMVYFPTFGWFLGQMLVNIPYIIHGAYGSGCSEVHCRKTGFRPSRGHTAAIGFGGENCSSTHCDEAWHGKILCQTESRPRAPRPWKEASGHSGPLYKSLKLMAIGRRMCNNIESPKRPWITEQILITCRNKSVFVLCPDLVQCNFHSKKCPSDPCKIRTIPNMAPMQHPTQPHGSPMTSSPAIDVILLFCKYSCCKRLFST